MSKERTLKKLDELLQELESYGWEKNLNPEVWKSNYTTILHEYLAPGDHRVTEMIFFNLRDSNWQISYEKVLTARGYVKSFIEYIKEKVPDPSQINYEILYTQNIEKYNSLAIQLTSTKIQAKSLEEGTKLLSDKIKHYEKNTVQWDQLDIDKLWLLIRKLPLKQFWALVIAIAFILGLVYWFGTLTIVHALK